MNLHLMIDLETLGVGNKAIVSAIGAVLFDLDTGLVVDKFYRVVEYQDQVLKGRKVDSSTIMWWFKQTKEAQEIYTIPDRMDTSEVLTEFNTFLNNNVPDLKALKVWGNGPSFDLTILESLLTDFDREIPWSFRNIRCLRTFKDFVYSGKDLPRVGVHHNAIDDCLTQMNVVVKGMSR